jgi:hypothetical protein
MPVAAWDRNTAGGNVTPAKDSLLEVTLNIADVALKIKCKGQPHFCRAFKKFTTKRVPSGKAVWRLDSIDINKKSCKKKLSRGVRSSFFDDPVRIDLENKRITRFHLKATRKAPALNDRLIAYAYSQALSAGRGMLLHAAAVVKDKAAYLFLGPSGGGKSTAASLSAKYKVIGDDVVAIKRSGASYSVFPTPWKQAAFTKGAERANAEVKALFFIRKSSRVSFKLIPPEEALKRMLYSHIHFLVLTRRPLLDDIFATASGFVKTIPAYDMEFTRDGDFWPELEEAVNARR